MLNKQKGKWHAAIAVNGRTTYLGYFDDEVAAAKAYDSAARKHRGQFAYLNFTKDHHSV